MKKIHRTISRVLIPLLLAGTAIACTSPDRPAETTDASADTAETDAVTSPAVTDEITTAEEVTTTPTEEDTMYLELIQPKRTTSKFKVIYDPDSDTLLADQVGMLCYFLEMETDVRFRSFTSDRTYDQEIVMGSSNRAETAEMLTDLREDEYGIRVKASENGEDGQIFIAAHSYSGYRLAIEYLVDNFYTPDNGFAVPADLDVTAKAEDYTLITSTLLARDPCILVEDGVYYAYRTGWNCLKNTSGNLEGPWENLGDVVQLKNPSDAGWDHWAPEVHRYNGAYYMFTTYNSLTTGHRGCTVLKSDTPEGPFVEISDGHVTPKEWDCIDGTLYVDPDGQPWMVFVHEWVSMPDQIGNFSAAKLSEDLTHFISEPIELFRADEPHWATFGVTDGCWMYTTESGDLLMLWSNNDEFGYCVGVARSSNGRLDGEWIHEDRLYSKYMTSEFDGGHAMIFTDTDGQMYLSFHSPNSKVGDRSETAVFLAIREEGNKLVWDKVGSNE